MIICGQNAYKVHKAILCSHSGFFRCMFREHVDCTAGFKEAQSGIVEIPCRKTRANTTKAEAFRYLYANTSRIEDFKWDSDADDPKFIEIMIHYFYHTDYLEVETAKVKGQNRREENFERTYVLDTGILIDHASMYAIGDKYDVPGLRDLALTKYREAYKHTSAGLANSMIVAWTSTIDSDMGLRNVIINILNNDTVRLMSKPSINQNVRDLPLLSHALLEKKLWRSKATIPYWPFTPRMTMEERLIISYLQSPPRPPRHWRLL